MRQIVLAFLIAIFSASCGGPRYVDYFPYHDDGTIKPRIAFVPIRDSSQSDLSWNLSTELSSALYDELMNSGGLYVLSAEEVGAAWTQCGSTNFFGRDLNFAGQFYNADFIVALDLIEHTLRPDPNHFVSSNPFPCNQILTLSMRVRVIDLRSQEPKDILYEIVKSDFLITAPYDRIDYTKYGWGWDKFYKTPYGQAHRRLICALASRLEEAIWSAK